MSLVIVDDVDDNLSLWFTFSLAAAGFVRNLQQVRDQRRFGVGQEGRGDDGDVAREAGRPVLGGVTGGREVGQTVAREIARRLHWERILILGVRLAI